MKETTLQTAHRGNRWAMANALSSRERSLAQRLMGRGFQVALSVTVEPPARTLLAFGHPSEHGREIPLRFPAA